MAWVIFLVVTLPILGILTWLLLDDSVVRIPPGRLGLLLVRGVATDKTLGPGVHWVPAFRRRMAVQYPGRELAFRAGDSWPPTEDEDELERGGRALKAALGDRTGVTVAYTVRFRLDVEMLQTVHNRFGTEGIWPAVRDESGRAMRHALGDVRFGVDDLFGPARRELEADLTRAVSAALAGVRRHDVQPWRPRSRTGRGGHPSHRSRPPGARAGGGGGGDAGRPRPGRRRARTVHRHGNDGGRAPLSRGRLLARRRPARGTTEGPYPPRSIPADGPASPDPTRSTGEPGPVERDR